MQPLSIVQVEEVSFSYDREPILSKVSFTIEEGEWIGVIGPNGGGKTTLLKLLLGFLQPESGSIRLFDLPVNEGRGRIGYVPQSLGFDPKFPISLVELVLTGRLSQLRWYGRYSREDRQIALEAIDQVGLSDLAQRKFSELSGGQRQRALIARALASRPEILLLDEFTANLDAAAEAAIYRFLKELRRKITIVMVTHDLPALISQVDRVLSVRRELVSLLPEEVCEHFALGVYHPPLINPKGER